MPYLVAVRRDAEAVDFYLQRKDVPSALAIAKMSEGRMDSPPLETRASCERGEESNTKKEVRDTEEEKLPALST